MENKGLTLLAVHAHPDDESISTGGTLAKYASSGVNTYVVYCTKGEAGEIQNPEFVPSSSDQTMKEIRLMELEKALKVLGIESHFFLGYRDSGMAGTPDNLNPRAFIQAKIEEATTKLVDIIRQVKPQVIVTYNEKGIYGHPDHIMANRITAKAFMAAGDPEFEGENGLDAWRPSKLYWTAIPLNRLKEMHKTALEKGENPGINPEVIGTPDEQITTRINVVDFLPKKFEALSCHQSQIGPRSFFRSLPPERINEFFGYEHYVCVFGCSNGAKKETDLFEGLR